MLNLYTANNKLNFENKLKFETFKQKTSQNRRMKKENEKLTLKREDLMNTIIRRFDNDTQNK
jgi:hypothetical protein